ncbi:Crp/Fnr family transcriptional regulator [Lacrimispora aerotolerans]|jgi:CRP-like cAMP-binding protein|uniref:Crp/Fnr family transcriptional regulator n=1 Tax=Lacrimispora aerotolerans TaxID=36832 RepID=UPI00047B37E9|nr:Crp/Fnr family transcriptional regulator [Lacrimispora aerotolerans]
MDVKEACSQIELFQMISEKSTAALEACGSLRRIPKGTHLFWDKEMNQTLYIVVTGFVSLYKINSQGERKTVFLLGKGDVVNEEVLQNMPASINCEAFESSLVLCFSKMDFLAIMRQDFSLTKAMFDSLALKNRRLYRQLKNTSNSLHGEKRVAAKLWRLSKDYGVSASDGTLINMELSVTYLADMLGSRRETVSRHLKHLNEQGLIRSQNGKIVIPDRDALSVFFKSP